MTTQVRAQKGCALARKPRGAGSTPDRLWFLAGREERCVDAFVLLSITQLSIVCQPWKHENQDMISVSPAQRASSLDSGAPALLPVLSGLCLSTSHALGSGRCEWAMGALAVTVRHFSHFRIRNQISYSQCGHPAPPFAATSCQLGGVVAASSWPAPSDATALGLAPPNCGPLSNVFDNIFPLLLHHPVGGKSI